MSTVVLPPVNMPKKDSELKYVMQSPIEQRPVGVSLGPHCEGFAQPKPDFNDTATLLAGVAKRAASRHPDPNQELLSELGDFVDAWLKRFLTPLPADSDVSFENWIDETNYPLWRKLQLRLKYSLVMNQWDDKHKRVKAFPKDENYPEFKHIRGIYSRTDEYKCFVGPFFKAIENVIYTQCPQFIKHVPVADRPMYIKNYLMGDGRVYATDYSAYESQFREEIMQMVEMKLYDYMCGQLPNYCDFKKHLETLVGRQYCVFKYFHLIMDTCRMSGEMCTSLGNGFSNLMFATFIAEKKGVKDLKIVVEGDDGLFRSIVSLSSKDFSELGLTIKIQAHDRIETASFCGIVFDSEELINVTDPLAMLVDFGWGDKKYIGSKTYKKKVLLRCKALSLAHQYPGCPIIQSLAHYGLRVTRDVRHDAMTKAIERSGVDMWTREQLRAAYKDENKIKFRDPGPRTRALVTELFGVDIKVQLEIEKYLDRKNDLSPIRLPALYSLVPPSWVQYYDVFARNTYLDEKDHQFFCGDGVDHTVEMVNLFQESRGG